MKRIEITKQLDFAFSNALLFYINEHQFDKDYEARLTVTAYFDIEHSIKSDTPEQWALTTILIMLNGIEAPESLLTDEHISELEEAAIYEYNK